MTKTRPQLGDRAFEVEWCYELPVNEFGDCETDLAKHHRRIVATHEAAMRLAREKYPEDKFGAVVITPVEFIDPYDTGIRQMFRWDYCGESEYYEGEE